MKCYLSPLCLAWCAATCGLASSAVAAERVSSAPPLPFMRDAANLAMPIQAVGDDVLARQTGKYAGASMISGFVVNLLSQWQLPNGALALAQGTLKVSANAANHLSAQVSTYAKVANGDSSAPGSSGANPDAVATGGQAVSVNGISQITQVAGNQNTGTNTALIDFDSHNTSPNVLPGAGASASTSAFATNSAGSIKAGISFTRDGVQLSLQTPAGIATQSITPSAAGQAGAIAQLLQIAGNRQLVSNQLQLQLQTQQLSPAAIRQMGVLHALQNGAIPRR